MMAAASGSRKPLTVSIHAGETASGTGLNCTFSSNTVTVTNNSGTLTYVWSLVGDGGSWSMTGQGTATVVPKVTGVGAGGSASGTLTCTATDNATGRSVKSNTAIYIFNNTGGGGSL